MADGANITKNGADGKNAGNGEQYRFKVFTAKQVQDYAGGSEKFLIDGILTPGLNLLAAPRKKGKSWMALDIALCVAGNGDFMGRKTEHGRVLYFALEDSIERMKRRINAVLDDEDVPDSLLIVFSTENTGSGLYKEIDSCLNADSGIKLVIIDVLQKVRQDKKLNQSEYSHDYNDMGALKDVADRHGITVLAVTHTRKAKDSSEPLNEIAGGVGVTGAADTILKIEGSSTKKENILYIVGRDMQEQRLAIVFDAGMCRWKYIGTEEELNVRSDEEAYASSPAVRTVKALLDSKGSWSGTVSELLEQSEKITGEPAARSVSALARKLNKFDGLLQKDGIIHGRPNPNGGPAGRIHKFILKPAAVPQGGIPAETEDFLETADLPEMTVMQPEDEEPSA